MPPIPARRLVAAAIIDVAVWSMPLANGVPPAWSQAASEPNRPAYQMRRFDEDWSVLRGDRAGPG